MFTNRTGQVRSGWLILLVLIAMLIAQIIFAMPGQLIFLAKAFTGTDISTVDAALAKHPWYYLFVYGGTEIGTIVAVLLCWKLINKRSLKSLGFRWSVKDLMFGLLLGALSITVIFFILLATGQVALLNTFAHPMFTVYTLVYLIFFILVGIAEEVLFRGYVMSTMENRGNAKWLIYVVSALIFSLIHGTNPNVSIFGLVNIALVGLLFAYMFDKTKSLWLPIGFHIAWNYFQGNVFGFAVSGTEPHGIYNVAVSEGQTWLTGGAFGMEGSVLTTLMIVFGYFLTRFYVRVKNT